MSSNKLDSSDHFPYNQQQLMKCIPQRAHNQQRGSVKQIRFDRGLANMSRHRSNMNSRVRIQRQDVSPPHSVLTNQNHFKQINLRQHNIFLKRQIQTMFARQKQYKKQLLLSKQTIRELESVNRCLQDHIQNLISNFIQEICRIQNLMDQQKSQSNISLHSNMFATHSKFQRDASETQSTIHKDLQELKTKVKQIYQSFQHVEPIHFRLEQGKSSKPVTPSFKQDSNFQKYISKQKQSHAQDYYPQMPGTLIKRQQNFNQRTSNNKAKALK